MHLILHLGLGQPAEMYALWMTSDTFCAQAWYLRPPDLASGSRPTAQDAKTMNDVSYILCAGAVLESA